MRLRGHSHIVVQQLTFTMQFSGNVALFVIENSIVDVSVLHYLAEQADGTHDSSQSAVLDDRSSQIHQGHQEQCSWEEARLKRWKRVAHRTECSPVKNAFECSVCLNIYKTGYMYLSAD